MSYSEFIFQLIVRLLKFIKQSIIPVIIMTKPTICGNNKIKKYKAVNQPLASLFSLPVKWMTERP